MSISKKIVAAVFGAIVLAVAAIWACAIYHVNALAVNVSSKILEMGESIDLGEYYLDSDFYLAPKYTLTVKKAEITSARQFLQDNGVEPKDIEKADIVESNYPDVLSVTFEVKNDNKANSQKKGEYSDTGVTLNEYRLVGDDKSKAYEFDQLLMEIVHPDWSDAGCFSIVPGSTYEINVPFSLYGTPPYFESYDQTYRDPVEGNEFVMLAANNPEKVFMKVKVD